MSTVSKQNDNNLPAVSLSLVKDSSNDTDNTINTSGSDQQISYAILHEMLFRLMPLIAENQAKTGQANAQSQINEADIVEKQAQTAEDRSAQVSKQVEDYFHQLDESAKWSLFGTIFKWVAAAIVITIGVLTSEFGVGLVLLAAVTIFMASPLFDMAVGALAKGLEAMGVPAEWSNIIAQVIIIVIATVVTFGAGAAEAGVSAARTGATLTASTVGSAASTAAKLALQIMLQALLSSSVVPQLIAKIPGIDKIPALQFLLTIIVTILAAVAAGKLMMGSAATGAKTLPQLLGFEMGEVAQANIRIAGRVSQATDTAAAAGSATAQGVYTLNASDILGLLAPLQALLQLFQGLSQSMSKMSDQTGEATKSASKNYDTFFNTRFYGDMEIAKEYMI